MSTGAAASTTSRLVASSSCRIRKARILASSHLGRTGVAPGWGRQSTVDCPTTVLRESSTLATRSRAPQNTVAPLHATAAMSALSIQGPVQSLDHVFLSSALLALALAYVATETSSTSTASSASPLPAAKITRKQGGGGPRNPLGASLVPRKTAEQDIRTLEEEAADSPSVVSEAAVQGARWTMEDAHIVENGGRFVGVFDGHGGSDVSEKLREDLYRLYREGLTRYHGVELGDPKKLKSSVPSIPSHVGALRGALNQVEEAVMKEDHLMYQGSTAVTVVLHVADDGRRTVLSANVGDSRAVMSRKGKAIDLTRDHKPSDEREKADIVSRGGEIEWDPYGQLYRVRDLSLSRAIGDRFAKPVVSSEAELKQFPVVENDDEFIVLASDGLWDVMTSQEAVDFVHECLQGIGASSEAKTCNPQARRDLMAHFVAEEALERGSADNVCVLVLWLKADVVKK